MVDGLMTQMVVPSKGTNAIDNLCTSTTKLCCVCVCVLIISIYLSIDMDAQKVCLAQDSIKRIVYKFQNFKPHHV